MRPLQTGGDGAGAGVLSADGRFVAYTTGDRQAPTEGQSILRMTGVEPSATPRTIRPPIPGVQVMLPRAWSPDNKSILATFVRRPNIDGPRNQPLVYDLVWITVATGDVRTIRTFENWQPPQPPKLSPDGAFIAFSTAPRRGGPLGEFHLFVMDANGAQVTDVVGIAGRNTDPVWSPTGSHIFFINDRIGKVGRSLWSVAVQGGRAVGDPAVVQRNFPGDPLSATTSGALWYRETNGGDEMTFVAERGSGAARIVQAFEGGRASWSPTGESIALIKTQGPGVVVRSVDGGEERLYQGSEVWGVPPLWVKNGSAFVVVSGPLGTPPWSFQLADIKTRTFKLLAGMTAGTMDRQWGVLSPDGSTLYTAVREAIRTPWTGIIAVDLVTGADRTVVTFPQPITNEGLNSFSIALSPDGSTIAMLAKHDLKQPEARLYSVRTDGTGFREIGSFPTVANSRPMVWTPDGTSILVVRTDADGAWRVLRVRASDGYVETDGLDSTNLTGSVKIPKLQPGSPNSLDISPDGSRLLFSSRTVARHSFWSLDGAVRLLKTP